MSTKVTREEALAYHTGKRKGKISVVPTKPCLTQRDLSMAYTPGVAEPCREIERDPSLIYEYTNKGNLVAVISNGTAVLGLGDIGAGAGKPVMEGKGVLFKRFADIDVFDIEVDSNDTAEVIRFCQLIEPTLGGINLEDIKAPECFEIEETLKKTMKIPVFHDDQHGTAIISGAALVNAVEVAGKKLDQVKVVFCGAGASGIACAKFYLLLGVRPENLTMVDTKGVIYKGRKEGMNPYKEQFARETAARTLADAVRGADVFTGVSAKGMLTKEMVKTMAKDPIIFAMANPDPEILPEEVAEVRTDAIMATGRSDYPNQVNNVLGFPFIFRGALDVGATEINEEMKLAASRALAALAREDVPDSVVRAYGGKPFKFGREYLIPKPFDYRVLLWEAVAVAEAAIKTGVARKPFSSKEEYVRELESRLSRTREVMHVVFDRAKQAKTKRIVFAEGEHPKIVRAAKILVDDGICSPILLGREEAVKALLKEFEVPAGKVEVIEPGKSPRFTAYAKTLHELRWRRGVALEDAEKAVRDTVLFGNLMVRAGDADGLISGLTMHYPETIRPALQVHHTTPGVSRAAGIYVLLFEERMIFIADTTVNEDPTAEQLAEIAWMTATVAKSFEVEPRIAMLSYSNFGSTPDERSHKVRRAVDIVRERWPELIVDGEMQADTAVEPSIAQETYPLSAIKGDANVLVCPDLQSANIAYKLLWRLGKVEAIGPILTGVNAAVQVLQRGVEVNDIVNMAAICVLKAELMHDQKGGKGKKK
jgi:malate dehydrogenase (oxaloacetate-decarboxylating)(NADP+)